MRLAESAWLILAVLTPLPWLWERARPRVRWPSLGGFARISSGAAGVIRHLPALLRGAAIACLAVALARPQTVGGRTWIAAKGVAIVLVLDQSSSMNVPDFPAETGTITRLEAARRTATRFIQGRPDDLIGLVAFANYPNRACAPTLDHGFLIATLRKLRSARPGDDGTNLGDAIVWALRDLRAVSPKRKVLVLLTDGENSPAVPHPTDPEDAAALARDLGVTLHTIAVGKAGGIIRQPEPRTGLDTIAEVGAPDFALLERLAQIGGGRAFTATDARGLAAVFHEIDTLEKSPIQGKVQTRYHERYAPWVGSALALLVLDRLLSGGRLRRLP